MELEEAIKILNLSQSQMRLGNLPDYSQNVYQAIETVLQALGNSIPKEIIENKKDELEKEMIEKGKLDWFGSNLEGRVQMLKELLKGE